MSKVIPREDHGKRFTGCKEAWSWSKQIRQWLRWWSLLHWCKLLVPRIQRRYSFYSTEHQFSGTTRKDTSCCWSIWIRKKVRDVFTEAIEKEKLLSELWPFWSDSAYHLILTAPFCAFLWECTMWKAEASKLTELTFVFTHNDLYDVK